MKNLYDYLFAKMNDCRDSSLKKTKKETKEEKKKMERNKVILLCIAAILFAAVVGTTAWGVQVNNARNESLKAYGDLSAKYNQTSEELEQIKDWLREERIYRVYENVGVGNIFIKEEGTKAVITSYSSNEEGRYLLYLTTGYNKDNEVFIDVKTFNPINGKETERWNCTGEDCLNMTMTNTKQ